RELHGIAQRLGERSDELEVEGFCIERSEAVRGCCIEIRLSDEERLVLACFVGRKGHSKEFKSCLVLPVERCGLARSRGGAHPEELSRLEDDVCSSFAIHRHRER